MEHPITYQPPLFTSPKLHARSQQENALVVSPREAGENFQFPEENHPYGESRIKRSRELVKCGWFSVGTRVILVQLLLQFTVLSTAVRLCVHRFKIYTALLVSLLLLFTQQWTGSAVFSAYFVVATRFSS